MIQFRNVYGESPAAIPTPLPSQVTPSFLWLWGCSLVSLLSSLHSFKGD